MSSTVHPVDERLPTGKLTALGLQHVLVMYAGAVAVPLIIGRALKLSPEQVTMLIQADLFCCGLVTLIQAFGATQWFGIKLPVMPGRRHHARRVADREPGGPAQWPHDRGRQRGCPLPHPLPAALISPSPARPPPPR